MAIPQIPSALIMGGNSPTEKAILSVMEAQIRGVLTSEKTTLFLKTTITPYQISNLPGIGMALYRAVVRLIWGSTWDDTTGTKKQVTSVKTTTVILDQFLTIDWKITEFDIERFITSTPDVASAMVSGWATSMIENLLQNLELTLLQGIKDYCIAKSLVIPINLLNLTQDQAVNAFYQIGNRNNKKLIKKVDDTTVGLNKNEITGVFGLDSTLQMTKAYQRLNYSQIAAETITTGKLYSTSVVGVETYESFYLEQDFNHTNETRMHLEKDYVLNDFLGAYISNYMWGMPISFEKIRQILDPATGNMKWLGKCLYASPTVIRPNLGYIIRPTMPTVAEITASKAKDWNTVPDKSTATFKSADYDSFILDLTDVIYFLDLGKITMAGATPTSSELDNAVVNAGNVGFTSTKATYSSITANNATMTGNNTDYIGVVKLTYEKA